MGNLYRFKADIDQVLNADAIAILAQQSVREAMESPGKPIRIELSDYPDGTERHRVNAALLMAADKTGFSKYFVIDFFGRFNITFIGDRT